MRVLVTGGGGFIGSHIAEYHLNKGDEVFVVDNLSTGSRNNISMFKGNKAFQFEEANIGNWPHLTASIEWAELIYHMAAVVGVYRVISEPMNVLNTNINGTEQLLQSIGNNKNRPRMILASTSSVYGLSEKQIQSETDALIVSPPHHPLRDYAISKLADEALGLAYFKAKQLPITMVRLFNTIGPRQAGHYGMVVPRFIQQACKHETITIYGDGNQTRSFCDVRDVVHALQSLVETKESYGEIVNVGNDSEISINHLAELIQQHAKSDSEIKHIPYHEAYGNDFTDIIRRKPNLEKLYRLTKFKHQWSLEQTVDELINIQMNTATGLRSI